MALQTVASRKMEDVEEAPAEVKAKYAKVDYKESSWAGPGKWTLVHDGKTVIVRHRPLNKAGRPISTACGNPLYTMVCGTEEEIEAEIKKLGLTAAGEAPLDAEIG